MASERGCQRLMAKRSLQTDEQKEEKNLVFLTKQNTNNKIFQTLYITQTLTVWVFLFIYFKFA